MQQLAGSESKDCQCEIEVSGVLWGEAPISQLSRHDIYCLGEKEVRDNRASISFVMSVGRSVGTCAPIGQIFMKFVLLEVYFWKVCREILRSMECYIGQSLHNNKVQCFYYVTNN